MKHHDPDSIGDSQADSIQIGTGTEITNISTDPQTNSDNSLLTSAAIHQIALDGTDGTSGSSGTSGVTGDTGAAGTSGSSGTSGATGDTGSTGASGTSGTSGTSALGSHYEHTQASAALTWTVNHNLGAKYVNVEVIVGDKSVSGTYDEPEITFVSTTQLTCVFSVATAGRCSVWGG